LAGDFFLAGAFFAGAFFFAADIWGLLEDQARSGVEVP
jgi:hypothetical protein